MSPWSDGIVGPSKESSQCRCPDWVEGDPLHSVRDVFSPALLACSSEGHCGFCGTNYPSMARLVAVDSATSAARQHSHPAVRWGPHFKTFVRSLRWQNLSRRAISFEKNQLGEKASRNLTSWHSRES